MEKHILLIDDDIDEMDFFLFAQKEMPGIFRCSYVSSAVEAVKSITNIRPDLVFLDVNMPAMNGLECLAQLRKRGVDDGTPIVLYSTNITDADCQRAKSLGAVDCIKKPVMLSSFCNMLREKLNSL